MEVLVYTIGHSNRSFNEFLALLKKFKIELLIDIRRYPSSRKYPHFNKEYLEATLPKHKIAYLWLGESLGGWRKYKGKIPPDALLRSPSFRAYVEHMRDPDFIHDATRILELAKSKNVALMCAERFPWRCHRYFLSDWLLVHGAKVVHIIDAERTVIHKLTRFARVIDGELVYI